MYFIDSITHNSYHNLPILDIFNLQNHDVQNIRQVAV